MDLNTFRGYFNKQLNEVAGFPDAKLYYGITDSKQHQILDIREADLNFLYHKLMSEGYKPAYDEAVTFRLPWFELKEQQ